MTSDRQHFQRRSPKQARSRATWDAIVEAAAQILEREGPEGLNTNRVAERAGVSIGTLYQYFPDKQAVVLAAARRELTVEVSPAPDRPRVLIQALIEMVEALRCLGAAPDAQATNAGASDPSPVKRQKVRRAPASEARRAPWVQSLIADFFALKPALVPIRVRTRR